MGAVPPRQLSHRWQLQGPPTAPAGRGSRPGAAQGRVPPRPQKWRRGTRPLTRPPGPSCRRRQCRRRPAR
eukprot:2853203-Alexandrium_andersonii.AAC.1